MWLSSFAFALALHVGALALMIQLGAPDLSSSRQQAVHISMNSVPSQTTKANLPRSAPQQRTTQATAPAQKTDTPQGLSALAANSDAALAEAIALIRARIEKQTRYPLALRRRGVAGRVEVTLTLNQNGTIESAQISKSSQSSELDHLALEAVQAAAPFEETKKMGKLILSLPIEFKLN